MFDIPGFATANPIAFSPASDSTRDSTIATVPSVDTMVNLMIGGTTQQFVQAFSWNIFGNNVSQVGMPGPGNAFVGQPAAPAAPAAALPPQDNLPPNDPQASSPPAMPDDPTQHGD